MAQAILYLYTESPLHAGTGSGLGAVDLPIQRERHTDFPVVQGSGIKGALRALAYAQHGNQHDQQTWDVFGPPPPDPSLAETVTVDQPSDYGGAITVGDARLLLFPVRSLRGVFAYVTAPLVLRRFHRDLTALTGQPPAWQLPAGTATDAAVLVTPGSALAEGGALVLEEYTFQATPDTQAQAFASWLGQQLSGLDPWWTARIQTHLAILGDDAFRDFVLYATEVVTRVRLDYATKTVAEGALWTEESLPADALLYSPVQTQTPMAPKRRITSDRAALRYAQTITPPVFQLGGDTTVGRGLVRPTWSPTEVSP